jgi:hypothetical protein
MCEFFSLVSDGKGKIFYFNWVQRQKILKGLLKDKNGYRFNADSHTSIIEYLREKRNIIDENFDLKFNKYEYNPLTKVFDIDRIDMKDDSEIIRKRCMELDFSKIVKPLIIKDIINPFDMKKLKINKKDIKLLKQWASVRASVRASVGASVWASVGDSVKASVRASVGASVWASVWASVGASVWASVGASVGASVWASVWVYISSFFDIKYKYDFSSGIQLWEKGLVPSFDGSIWRLYGYQGRIIWEDKDHII